MPFPASLGIGALQRIAHDAFANHLEVEDCCWSANGGIKVMPGGAADDEEAGDEDDSGRRTDSAGGEEEDAEGDEDSSDGDSEGSGDAEQTDLHTCLLGGAEM